MTRFGAVKVLRTLVLIGVHSCPFVVELNRYAQTMKFSVLLLLTLAFNACRALAQEAKDHNERALSAPNQGPLRQSRNPNYYCLAQTPSFGAEYLVYAPFGGSFTMDLSAMANSRKLAVEWFNPASGETII